LCIDNARRYTREPTLALALQEGLLPLGVPEQLVGPSVGPFALRLPDRAGLTASGPHRSVDGPEHGTPAHHQGVGAYGRPAPGVVQAGEEPGHVVRRGARRVGQ
ncbi:hypothetical protein, partial [Streptomyces sp. WM6372]|uniref:hypothetical protein n=1 Tax=Streptomyces sp. WM6372 TaxID=1415555 RepID=UPI001F2872E2